MASSPLKEVTRQLPASIRDAVDGYAHAVSEQVREIFRSANIRYTERKATDFVFIAGIRRLWTIVDGNYWLLSNSLKLLSTHGVSGISYGATLYSGGELERLKTLRDNLQVVLSESKLMVLVTQPSLHDLAKSLQGRENLPWT